jgi:hypothetical protein
VCDPGRWVTDLSGDMGNSSGMCMEVRMPWQETCVMDERMSSIVDWQRQEATVAELCRYYGISRKTGYKLTGSRPKGSRG